jgi:hypothetical protein
MMADQLVTDAILFIAIVAALALFSFAVSKWWKRD